MNESLLRFDTGCPRTLASSLATWRAGLAALLVALPLAGFAPLAHADRADRDKPLNIEADNMTYDDLKQLNIFTGHVVATKGTIVIKADRVEVHQDPQGYQYATGTSTGNDLAYFRQKREGLDEYIDGTAERIDYDGKQDLTTLTTRATVHRLQGLSTVMDEVHGSVITYDGQNDFYTAKAGKDVAGPGNPNGRVRAMLAPRNGGPAPLTGGSATLVPATQFPAPGAPQP
ncbi:lipopolysaccharide transport periplasmic protein LptA [Paraburkholderia acidicola]|uniref:Lipopolysaccharide export system protein LptA n=1 Tax=Paraburkholderia acidicola TaxID=1912599 RepID=A0A2A4EYG0_9BURK|nr:lipopolysaccharide transport periplasmic protein LptA [Paraburkholderia acidicola]PCE25747.1 lipopolysaccharide transport periplasmic protein LptA [Paraburkholderia acidicola]